MLDKVVTKFEDFVTIFCFSAMSIVTLISVFYRYVMSNPLIWSEEVARYFMIWGVFIGISLVTRKNAQLSLDIIESFAPYKIRRVVSIFNNIFIILFLFLLFILSFRFMMHAIEIDQVTPILRINYMYVYSALPIGFLLATYRAIQVFIITIKNGSKKVEEESTLEEREVHD